MGAATDHSSPPVEIRGDSDYVKVYIGGVLAFHFLRKHYRGLSAYHENIYTIEIILQDKRMVLEYDNRPLWLNILVCLDSIL